MANKNRTEDPLQVTPAELEQPWAETMPQPGEAEPTALAVLLPEPALVTEPTEPEPQPERLTPHAWAEKLGLAEKADPARPWIEKHSDWRFAAADKCHGWSDHAQAWQAPGQELLLTLEDFEAALEAGAAFPARPAHGPACGKGFEDRALTKEQLEAKAKEAAKAAEVKSNG